MISQTQIANTVKTVAKAVPSKVITKETADTVKVPGCEVMQHLSSIGRTNSAILDRGAIQEKLRKEIISSRASKLTPIESIEEYKTVMDRIKSSSFGEKLKEDIKIDYQNIDSIEEGLLSYCGNRADIHNEINMYLSGRGKAENEPLIQDIIRALDFSLKDLDKHAGTFEGMVFRQGVMKGGEGQFWSTANKAGNAGNFDKAWNNPEAILDREFSVVKTKSGHQLSQFQKNHKSKFIAEEEILLPREKDYRLVPQEEYTSDMLEAREEMLNNLFQHNNKQWKKLKKGGTVSFDREVKNPLPNQPKYESVDVDLDYLRNQIKVFEEI